MVKTVSSAARTLIKAYGLHANEPPVKLAPLEETFPVVLRDLSETGLRAFAYINETDEPYIVVDENLPEALHKVYYAHEIGHVILGHPGNLQARDVDNWFETRQERDAWSVAAELLIPRSVTIGMDEISPHAIAERCEVPVKLVEFLPSGW